MGGSDLIPALSALLCVGKLSGTEGCIASLQHYAQNALELNVHILFIHALKSKPNASKEEKMKEKCTVKGGGGGGNASN